ncbi:Cholesterol dehydrogenase [Nocardia otitidiscaviarum]|uniref:Cholesterol dehydrogenase n=1 Tax=Nocardia otitidiscaviarum TaxID=1823 RepID=A0A379JIW7_9NOCA|nr:NAD-dependent epimerase/dehydratase family protein [Nocardia otitidiscaviarum]SUD48211.1 Cholesterol dehydrogenase [Nocardia otitidiscaviarum]
MTDRVLVTGVSGYLAGHVVAELQEHGYAVRGTVRSLADTAATAHLRGVELVEADLSSDVGWAEAVAGCRYVLHTASPFPLGTPEHEDELVRPAVQGMRRVLSAARDAGVERVVYTSSIAAVRVGHTGLCTEADWSDPAVCDAYEKSKTLAERAAWDFAHATAGFELAVVNPGMILGPVRNARVGTSVEGLRLVLAGEMPGVPRLNFCTVDVRDAAVGHRLAMEVPAAAGNRYILAGDQVSLPHMARILAGRYRITARALPDWLVRLAARFDATARTAVPYLGRDESVSAEKASRELGWTMRPLAETLLDTADSLIRFDLVPDPGPARRRLPRGTTNPRPAPAA